MRQKLAIMCAVVGMALLSAGRPAAEQKWVQATASAEWPARYRHAAVVHLGRMWVMGGAIYTNYLSDVWSSGDGVSWECANYAAPWGGRSDFGLLKFQNAMWLLGGQTPFDRAKNDVWFSQDGMKWNCATSSPSWPVRLSPGCVVYDSKLWVLGGTGLSPTGRAIRLNDVWWSSDGITWTSATMSAPWAPRAGFACLVHDGKIWVIGGAPLIGYEFDDVWCSSDGANWTLATAGAHWGGRVICGFVEAGGKLWLCGGSGYSGLLNDVWFSGDGSHWGRATLSASWTPRDYNPVLFFQNKIWLLGGYDEWTGPWKNDVWFTATLSAVPRWRLYR